MVPTKAVVRGCSIKSKTSPRSKPSLQSDKHMVLLRSLEKSHLVQARMYISQFLTPKTPTTDMYAMPNSSFH